MNTVIDIHEALGADEWEKAARKLFESEIKKGFELVGFHLYRAADCSIRHARVRMHKPDPTKPKGYDKFIRPFYKDGSCWKKEEPVQAGGKLLYGVPEAMAAPDALLIVPEGEQKADALTKIGAGRFVGVTSGSATSARAADWAWMAGRRVLIFPDYDESGTKYADEVTATLEALGCTVERLDVAAMGLPRKGDVMDWIEAFTETHDRMPNADDVLALPTKSAPPESRVETISTAAETEGESDEHAIERLAALKPMQYDRVRKEEAKRMGAQVSTLDKLVAAARKEDGTTDGHFADVELWHAPVDGAALLDEIVRVVHRFIVCGKATACGAALWIAMTWLMESVGVAPIAAITAPEKRCGKSQLLSLMGRLSSRPLPASNITPAALFRVIEALAPTLLIDEADAFMRENEELRGLLNCGHTRDGAYVIRLVGDDHAPKQFCVWGAKAIAGIGQLADTIMDRSITLELRRKLPHEHVDKLRHAEPSMFEVLRAKLARWAVDSAEAVRAARPVIPDALHDRAADNWEPLLQIAEVAGGAWPEMARQAALKLSGDAGQSQSSGAELLTDIQEVFEMRHLQRISSADLLINLCDDEEKPWATLNRGKPMTPRQLSQMLGEYGISTISIKFGYGDVRRGYRIEHFQDAFSRYLGTPVSATPLPPNVGEHLEVATAKLQFATHVQNPLPAAFSALAGEVSQEVASSGYTESGSGSENHFATPKTLSGKPGSGVADTAAEIHGEGHFMTDDEAEDRV
ncbi:DUF3631 domain-containing protein [Paraburkholderia panacisoli]|nr:DUF3631 domain-containing protein [Paraburkholderia panacisoli]